MGIKKAVWDRLKWKLLKQRLDYTEEEMALFKSNPKNEDVLDKGAENDILVQRVVLRGRQSQ